MGDALRVIVHRAGEVIGKHVIGAIKHEIADLALEVLADPALQQVLKGYFCSAGAYSPCAQWTSARNALAAGPRINRAAGKRFTDFLSTAPTGVNQSTDAQLLQGCLVCACAFALINDVAIPVQPECFHAAKDRVRCARGYPRLI